MNFAQTLRSGADELQGLRAIRPIETHYRGTALVGVPCMRHERRLIRHGACAVTWIVLTVALLGCETERELPDAEPWSGTVHKSGILDETSDNFHGKEVARHNNDLAVCAKCHGDDLNGGAAHQSCMKCHQQGPTGCASCHQDGPTTGAHVVHRVDGKLACAECHRIPDTWTAPGHIDAAPAEVTFGALAATRTTPSYEGGTCTVYCHLDTRPTWTQTPVGGCDRCHGAPPPSHKQSQCASCHAPSAPHIDGVVQVGSACDSCHGKNGDPAPPNDLSGNQFPSALGVGAHQIHLKVPSGLRAPIPCTECHVVPATVDAPGHIDSPLPAEVNSTLGWDRTAQTCATAWCHMTARPRWTESGGAVCGSCHGVPPATPSHTPDMPFTSCVNCHPPGFTKHIDGVLDVL